MVIGIGNLGGYVPGLCCSTRHLYHEFQAFVRHLFISHRLGSILVTELLWVGSLSRECTCHIRRAVNDFCATIVYC